MDARTLEEVTKLLRQLAKAQLERNYVQLERDTTQSFFDITKSEVNEVELMILAKEREAELKEYNHRTEVRVYVQKVRHLEYEHAQGAKRVRKMGDEKVGEERDDHAGRDAGLRGAKRALRSELAEAAAANEAQVRKRVDDDAKNLTMMRAEFERERAALEARCEAQVDELQVDLELQRRVTVHEITERKNLHINTLISNHKDAFAQVQAYYNDITRDNLRLITELKREVTDKRRKAVANQRLMLDIAAENRRMSHPLQVALEDVSQLQHALRDADKDAMGLRNARARLRSQRAAAEGNAKRKADLEASFAEVDRERNALYDAYEHTLRAVQRRADFANLALERRLERAEDGLEARSAQLQQVLQAAALDPAEVGAVTDRIEEMLQV